ncbi:hypothetical protein BDN70DRAFT_876443 [Pholiota conissans]|uniref:Uncharacterized protein n=1 Tax=Pholiota conissans TaxID=109636 RepID=A0A9P6CVZ6_9AGAR|nr:hypothetical protein BDN70DRAFT_876443 [Pholiota conissans]
MSKGANILTSDDLLQVFTQYMKMTDEQVKTFEQIMKEKEEAEERRKEKEEAEERRKEKEEAEERRKEKEEAEERMKEFEDQIKANYERMQQADELAKTFQAWLRKVEEKLEKEEEQRETDIQDAKEVITKLEATLKEHQGKIANLERCSHERELEQRLSNKATRRSLESLSDDINAATNFLATEDEATLDQIKCRNLLERGQKWAAGILQLSDDTYLASVRFREELGPSFVLEDRRRQLIELLEEKKDNVPEAANLLDGDKPVLTLLAEHLPQIRIEGNVIAHGNAKRSWYEGSVSRATGPDKVGLTHLLTLVCGPKA